MKERTIVSDQILTMWATYTMFSSLKINGNFFCLSGINKCRGCCYCFQPVDKKAKKYQMNLIKNNNNILYTTQCPRCSSFSGISLSALPRCANSPAAVKMSLTTWFEHLKESYAYKEVQFEMFCLPVKTSWPLAENINEIPTVLTPNTSDCHFK